MKKQLLITLVGGLLVLTTQYTLAGDLAAGEKVFEETCSNCHSGGFKGWASGAPDIGKKEAWANIITKPTGDLYRDIFQGTEDHEPKGDCDSCSQEDINGAIDYMLSAVNKLN